MHSSVYMSVTKVQRIATWRNATNYKARSLLMYMKEILTSVRYWTYLDACANITITSLQHYSAILEIRGRCYFNRIMPNYILQLNMFSKVSSTSLASNNYQISLLLNMYKTELNDISFNLR